LDLMKANKAEIRQFTKQHVSILHDVQPCDYAHCCLLTGGVDVAVAVAVNEGQAVDEYSRVEVWILACSHSSAEYVGVVVEENTTDRDLVSACHHKPDKVQEIDFFLVLACYHSSA